jgi:hypothetical protein
MQPLVLNGARVMGRPADGVVEDADWSRLNGILQVTSPVQIVLPDNGIGGIQNPPAQSASVRQLTQDAFAQVIVDAINPADPVRAFEWERIEPSFNALGNAARIQWRISASCPSGVQQISMSSAGGEESQDFGGAQNVTGQFETQSFSAHGLEQICLDWADGVSSSHLCNQAPEDCPDEESFQLTGGVTPPLFDDTVDLTVRCGNGATVTTTGRPQMTLRCGAVPFGFPH